jgi:UPF0288 family protein (methanogenesis marker protein 3)
VNQFRYAYAYDSSILSLNSYNFENLTITFTERLKVAMITSTIDLNDITELRYKNDYEVILENGGLGKSARYDIRISFKAPYKEHIDYGTYQSNRESIYSWKTIRFNSESEAKKMYKALTYMQKLVGVNTSLFDDK